MRLINTWTLKFREFFDEQRPRYAILSHTWEDQEVSYLDFLFLTSSPHKNVMGAIESLLNSPSTESAGFKKIKAWCGLAAAQGYEWVWVDTCCIDKSSSAELQEAINSMYRWYQDAAECFVYLPDVTVTPNGPGTSSEEASRKERLFLEELSRARWFTRGWTLQELLAPKSVLFCNRQWQVLASKNSISAELSRITKIHRVFLDGTYAPNDGTVCSVAMRMSWVSQRQTTRVEDLAYCMLGLFDGRKAFMRLQLEILKQTDDDSIYAWTAPIERSGLLATWPTAFKDSGTICQVVFPDDEVPWLPPVMTSIGLKFTARYQRLESPDDAIDQKQQVRSFREARSLMNSTSIVLHCGFLHEGSDKPPITQVWPPNVQGRAIVIFLDRVGPRWQRVRCSTLVSSFYGNSSVEGLPGSQGYIVYYVQQDCM